VSDLLDIRKTVAEARSEARALGSPRIEAEHLLLALASHPRSPAGRLLESEGLDGNALRNALGAEFRDSLSAAGVHVDELAMPAPTTPPSGPRALGQSAKLALQRALRARAGRGRARRRLGSLHLLLGILEARAGTAVRALDRSGIDRARLKDRVRAHLAEAA
jgi:D-alanyl-D-alanine carboxypeptidase